MPGAWSCMLGAVKVFAVWGSGHCHVWTLPCLDSGYLSPCLSLVRNIVLSGCVHWGIVLVKLTLLIIAECVSARL